ncbi:uncharacterized protein OCT59_006577 [Rhizophagus irregularis]|uniref:uncharacterized protein n=1 Tax=Rhizophagus irregularis TaxID=588596 RepID=UPI000CC3038E|nr:hypothetical protein OCT59_006577 [Rhizophagus irregularis]GBC20091.1 hypothetical protein GLOIN_2v1781563 [Rhizophagus irregularis DAOM 181602=DAOM 197198]
MNIDSNAQIRYGNDLSEYIPRLYRLLDLCKDDCLNHLADKIIISKDSLKKLCNDIVPLSFKSISEIDYMKLNSTSFRLIGCYGNHILIAKLLLNGAIINQQLYDLLIASVSIDNTNTPSLRPGIYLLIVNTDLALVIHWPEIGYYEENSSSKLKKNMINLHRYLTKLTDHQLCFMSDKDLENFDWNHPNSDDDDDICYEFEVKKNQEREDFKIYPGFEVNLSDKIKTEINNNIQDDIPLYPIVVGSATNQSFVTRQLIKVASELRSAAPIFTAFEFQRELQTRLKGRKLLINRETMNMKSLEILIKHGLKMEDELLSPSRNAITAAKIKYDKRRDQEKDETNKDIGIISNLAWKKLRDSYRSFEDFMGPESSEHENIISDEDLERIRRKYPDMEAQINKKILINSRAWSKLKKRYALTSIIVIDILKMTQKAGKSNEEAIIKIFYNLFVDEETDAYKLVKKHTEKPQSSGVFPGISNLISFSSVRINHADEESTKISRTLSDIKFVQDLVNSPFFGKFNDLKQKILDVFFEEYQNWRKNTYPSNIKEILPRVSFNRQLAERLTKEFEQEKQEIEDFEFNRICNVIEEKYQDGSMRLNVRNISASESMFSNGYRFHHEIETTQPDQLQITIYETSLEQADTLQLQEDELHVPNPTLPSHYSCGQYGTSFHLDPQVYDFRKISQFDNHKFLLVLWNKKASKAEIFFDTAQKLAQNFKQSYSNRSYRILNTDENYFIAVNEPKELIAIFDTRRAVLNILSFSYGQANLYPRNSNIQLLQWYSGTVPDIQYFLFIKDTEDLCFVEKSGRARIFNLINQQFRPAVCNLPPSTANVLSSPDGSCIVAFVKEKIKVENSTNDENENDEEDNLTDDEQNSTNRKSDLKEICRAYVYFCTNFGGSVSKVIDLPPTIQSLEYLHFTCINKLQNHLMSLDLENGCFNSIIVKITVERNQYRFQEQSKDIKPVIKPNILIDAYGLMFEKYPIENCIDSEQNSSLSLKIVIDIDENNEIEKYGKKFEEYITKIFENLKHSTKKPAEILKKFSTSVIAFQELDIENTKYQKEFSSQYNLGEWIIQLCCLIPIQIAKMRNNLFQPLKDGLLLDESDQVELDNNSYSFYLDGIVKNISFGWYEGVFKYFGNKKIKIVSSMGEQSCGKSFMLNHLIGTTFDASAMNCTEGVWMSLVNTKEYIYVAFYFESLKSYKRTPQEELFLILFNTLVSNLILFKVENQSYVKIDSLSMMQRFQDGVVLFESDSKISQANLCIIIKDVPKTKREYTIKELKSKISQLVSEEGEDNFISKMYKGKVDCIPWPIFNNDAWFKALSIVNKKLEKQEVKYENAITFLQNIKVIMAKLKICDWGSLDESLIQIRIARLGRLLPIAISYGLEQKDSVSKQLLDHDTGKPIEDPTVNLTDILDDVESIELLPDANIHLYDENESFAQLSEDLRDHFEETVQSREVMSDENKWFENYAKFLNYIVERRISRVRKWYAQNTVKLPLDNSNVINRKNDMEQKLDKLTLLWTLCGLICHQCHLKCIKNFNHEDDHDCLTNHKCNFSCHFIEAHNKKLIQKCNYKSGHEGKHMCKRIKHLCNEPCNLIDKRNCQKVCSKEIGHPDGEHLCQSTRHYCEENCSLSTRTVNGDYHCPNKCIKPCEEPHDSHRCESETCPIQCSIPNCQRKCQSNDHFHSYSGFLQVDHFCGNEHQCHELCEDDGVCKVVIEPKKQPQGTLIKYVQLSERLRCSKKIPPNESKHIGKHTHNENEFHFCEAQCQFCGYFCTLPYGHKQLHNTKHGIDGNMTQIKFSEDNASEYTSVDSQGTFTLCNMHCKNLGRHRHVGYCQNEEICKLRNDNDRHDLKHINEQIQPNPDRPKDFISHKIFWKRTGFKDPYSYQEKQDFTEFDNDEHTITCFNLK